MPYIVGFLSTLVEADFRYLLQAFQDQLASEVAPWPCARSGPNLPGDLAANEVFVCTRWANGDYNQLPDYATQLRDVDPTPKVIAAVGGDVSALAAESRIANIPIIFLTGRNASEESDNHRSNSRGIYLETTRWAVEHTARHRKLVGLFGISRKNIYNLVFKRSAVNNDEKDWTNPVTVQDTTPEALTTAFNQIMALSRAKVQALTISADSYFFTKKVDIVGFANDQFKRPMIYPFRGWVEQGGLMSVGPNLVEMYKALGSWAAQIVTKNLSSSQLAQLPAKTLVNEFVVNDATAVSQFGRQEANRIEQGAIVI